MTAPIHIGTGRRDTMWIPVSVLWPQRLKPVCASGTVTDGTFTRTTTERSGASTRGRETAPGLPGVRRVGAPPSDPPTAALSPLRCLWYHTTTCGPCVAAGSRRVRAWLVRAHETGLRAPPPRPPGVHHRRPVVRLSAAVHATVVSAVDWNPQSPLPVLTGTATARWVVGTGHPAPHPRQPWALGPRGDTPRIYPTNLYRHL